VKRDDPIDWELEHELLAWMHFVERLELAREIECRLFYVPLRLAKHARNRARGVLKTGLRGSP
jgi:hypothetical protein